MRRSKQATLPYLTVLLVLMPTAACEKGNDRSAAATAAGRDTADLPMHGMPSRAVGSGTMVEEMRATMRTMQAVSAETMRTALPMHRQMAADLMAQMEREMNDMKLPANASWSALMDSLHHDMARMPEMNASELGSMMPAYHARLTRLMDLHHEMIRSTQPSR